MAAKPFFMCSHFTVQLSIDHTNFLFLRPSIMSVSIILQVSDLSATFFKYCVKNDNKKQGQCVCGLDVAEF